MSDKTATIKDLKEYLRRLIDGVKTLDDINYNMRISIVLAPSETAVSKQDTLAFFEKLLLAAGHLDDNYPLSSTFQISQEDVNGQRLASILNEKAK